MKNMFVFHSIAKNQLTEVKWGAGGTGPGRGAGAQTQSFPREGARTLTAPPLPHDGPTELAAMVLPPHQTSCVPHGRAVSF